VVPGYVEPLGFVWCRNAALSWSGVPLRRAMLSLAAPVRTDWPLRFALTCSAAAPSHGSSRRSASHGCAAGSGNGVRRRAAMLRAVELRRLAQSRLVSLCRLALPSVPRESVRLPGRREGASVGATLRRPASSWTSRCSAFRCRTCRVPGTWRFRVRQRSRR
jgi:hypothetical protein